MGQGLTRAMLSGVGHGGEEDEEEEVEDVGYLERAPVSPTLFVPKKQYCVLVADLEIRKT